MTDPVLAALESSGFIPTPHWQPRCELCRLARTHPDAYGWVTRALLDGELTQQQISDRLHADYGIEVSQPQLSGHKTRHLDPDLADARETFIGHRVFLEFAGDMPPEQMAVVYAQLAIVELGERLREAADAAEAARLGSSIAALSKALQAGAALPLDLETAAMELTEQKVREATAKGEYQEAFAKWVEAHYPSLLPMLAKQTGEAGQSGPAAAEPAAADAEGTPSAPASPEG